MRQHPTSIQSNVMVCAHNRFWLSAFKFSNFIQILTYFLKKSRLGLGVGIIRSSKTVDRSSKSEVTTAVFYIVDPFFSNTARSGPSCDEPLTDRRRNSHVLGQLEDGQPNARGCSLGRDGGDGGATKMRATVTRRLSRASGRGGGHKGNR